MRREYKGYLQKRLLIPLAVVILSTVISLIGVTLWHTQKSVDDNASHLAQLTMTVLHADIESDAGKIHALMQMVQDDERVRDALQRGDRDTLLHLAAPLYLWLRGDHHITHFYFSTPDRVNLLRVHDTARYGDRIDRHTTLEAERSGEVSWGLEMGVLGTFTLRVVIPWFHQGELIGYLEMGEEIDHLIDKLRRNIGLELYLFVEKRWLDEALLTETMAVLGRRFEWGHYPDHLLISSPQPEAAPPTAIEQLLLQGGKVTYNRPIPASHGQARATPLPLSDVRGEHIGMLLLITRSPQLHKSITATLGRTSALLLLLGGGVFLLFWRLARQTENALDSAHNDLLEEHRQQERMQRTHIKALEEHNRLLGEADMRLRRSQHELVEAQRIAHLGSWEWDILNDRMHWSEEVYAIFGLSCEEEPLSYEALLATIPEPQAEHVDQEMRHAMEYGGLYMVEHTILRPTGEERRVREQGEVTFAEGRAVRMNGTIHDITDYYRHAKQVEHLGRIFEYASNEIYLIDAQNLTILQANHTAAHHLNYLPQELLGMRYCELAPRFEQAHLQELVSPLYAGKLQEVITEGYHRRKGGEGYPVELRLQLGEMEGRQIYIALALDTSERLAHQRALQHQALHDPLTNLPNRSHFFAELGREIARARRSGELLQLLHIDVRGLAEINDTLGHDNGDYILQHFAQRMGELIRETDSLARIAGDEFGLLLPNTSLEEAQTIAARMMLSLHEPFDIDAYPLTVEASIGIAAFPEHGDGARELLQHADVALKQAKKYGGGVSTYRAELDPFSIRKLVLSSQLRLAVEHGELELHYQPKVERRNRLVTEVEALLRWRHPEHGMVSPGEFIPIAEGTGQIRQLTRWVIRQACRQLAMWQGEGVDIRIGVNLSAHNLGEHDLLRYIIAQVQQHGIEHRMLSFEVTESAVMRDPDYTVGVLKELNSLGHRISIDDYGTGYSSLSYLQRLPADELKIDSSFIFGMLENEDNALIVRSTIALAHNLGKSVTAEGVETIELAEILTILECDVLQGYYFSRPLPIDELTQWLQQHPNHHGNSLTALA